jgi:hypothetical protein
VCCASLWGGQVGRSTNGWVRVSNDCAIYRATFEGSIQRLVPCLATLDRRWKQVGTREQHAFDACCLCGGQRQSFQGACSHEGACSHGESTHLMSRSWHALVRAASMPSMGSPQMQTLHAGTSGHSLERSAALNCRKLPTRHTFGGFALCGPKCNAILE